MRPSILIINGPNLNLLGSREPSVYGSVSFEDYLAELRKDFPDLEIGYYQSNDESDLVTAIQEARLNRQGIILNPAAYTHTSIAIRDALAAVGILCIEVHITDIRKREEFRRHSMISELCWCSIRGLGLPGYRLAMERMREYFRQGD
jgi:3-dehydroquinate dehydratase-2